MTNGEVDRTAQMRNVRLKPTIESTSDGDSVRRVSSPNSDANHDSEELADGSFG